MKNEKEIRNKKNLQKLIESIIDEETIVLLSEQEGDVLTKAFIEPFTDIFKTAKHGIESSITSVVGNTKKVAKQFAVAALPFIAASEVTRIGDEENQNIKNRLGELDNEYADVLQRNWDTLRTRDLAGLALMLNPSLTIAKETAFKSPAVALGVLEVLSGGHPAIRELRKKANKLSKKVMPPRSGETGGSIDFAADDYGWGGDFGGFGESVKKSKNILKEQQPKTEFTRQELDQKVYEVIQKLLQKKDVQNAIRNSPTTIALKTAGLDAVVKRANEVAKFTSMDQFEQYLGPEFDKYLNQIESDIPEETPPEELKKLEEQQVEELKKVFKQFYTKYIQDLAQTTPGIKDEAKNALKELEKLG